MHFVWKWKENVMHFIWKKRKEKELENDAQLLILEERNTSTVYLLHGSRKFCQKGSNSDILNFCR